MSPITLATNSKSRTGSIQYAHRMDQVISTLTLLTSTYLLFIRISYEGDMQALNEFPTARR